MNLRRDRTHHTGNSNLASRLDDLRPQTALNKTASAKARFSFSLFSKGKQFEEILDARVGRTAATPNEQTRTFYNQTGKSEKPKLQIGHPRILQLEDPLRVGIPFTGESTLIYDKNLEKYRDHDSPVHAFRRKADPHHDKEHLAKEKHEIHAKAIQETQLVGYDKQAATLKDNVNLEKVREAKRVISRKYGNRKNMHLIYSAWDPEKKGHITVENFYAMSKRLGLNLNYDEARVLLASADKTAKGRLTLDEFLDLIYNKDDALNVALDRLSKHIDNNYILQKEKLENEDDNVIKKLEEDAKRTRNIKHFNQVTLILKNKLNEITNSFIQMDPFKKGYTTYDAFDNNIKKLGVDEKLVSHDDIKAIFKKYSTDGHTLNYKTFLDALKSFNFYAEDAYREYDTPVKTKEGSETKKIEIPQANFGDNIDIIDCRIQPYSTVYNYLGKKRKVSRMIQKFFPKKEDLQTYFMNKMNIKDKSQIDNQYLSKKEAKDVLVDLFKEFDVTSLNQRDFQGFLSSLIYNKQDYTHLQDVIKGIYDEDENDLILKINERKRGPPPHMNLGTEPDYEEHLRAQTASNAFGRGGFFKSNSFSVDPDFRKKKVDEILKKIDDKIFVERKKAYNIYKMFDVDKDGFVSRKDFVTKAEEILLVPKEDIPVLLDYLDPTKKGFVNFAEFHKKIRTNAYHQDEDANPTVFPSVVPSKENFDKVTKLGNEATKTKFKEFVASAFRNEDTALRPASRFGNAPAWKNTFFNLQAPSISPMFVSERERFLRTPESRVLPSTEDKEKKRRIMSAKIDGLKFNQNIIKERAHQDMVKFDNLEANRLRTKMQSAANHEQSARLRNDYSHT